MKGQVDVRTRVRAPLERTFVLFATQINTWWKRGPRFRFGEGREGNLILEPWVGGRFFERFVDAPDCVIGRVDVWEPPRAGTSTCRLVLAWSPPEGGREASKLEVRFKTVAGGTEVHLQHRGLEKHPGKSGTGLRSTALRNVKAVWWADLVRSFSHTHRHGGQCGS
ncbi:MAG: hypothetical protein AAGA48_32035 [Myxococcota bacterium]